jgi:hypothetical protein
MIEDAQDRAYNLAHDIILAATHGDEVGAEALSKVFAIEIQTILNMGLQSPQGIS